MVAMREEEIGVMVADISGQRQFRIPRAARDRSVGELIGGVLPQMHMPQRDGQGRAIAYQARLDREGRYLHASEIIGEALQPEDKIVLTPNIDAGGVMM